MKNLYSFLIIAAFFCLTVQKAAAVPAYPEPIEVTQPDGTTLTVRLHGDEFFHYTATEDGYLIVKNPQNYYVFATVAANGAAMPTARIARNANARTAADASFLQSLNVSSDISRMRNAVSPTTMQRAAAQSSYEQPQRTPLVGSPNFLVLLVEFSNRSFVNRATAQTRYSNLVNETGYSANGSSGSVKDFYKASSYGQFTPNFVVMPPVTLSHTAQYYCDNDGELQAQMIIDACNLVNSTVNFADYDNDGDGKVDNVLVFVAGWDRAQGGDDATNVWSQRWAVQPGYNYSGDIASTYFDSKRIFDYFVTSELRGSSGNNMVNIGTFVHEFGHILGLPDYYHTTTSSIPTLSYWSTMASGSYCNTSRTPPLFSAYDRFFLGWLTPEQYTEGQKTLYPLSQSGTAAAAGQAYLVAASTHNLNGGSPSPAEFFVLEQREKTGWDAYIGNNSTSGTGGMLIWHIDYSASVWNNNTVNNYTGTTQTQSSHMRVYLEPTDGLSQTSPGAPFTSGSFTPKRWNGTALTAITNITKNGTTSMNFGVALTCPRPSAISAGSITTSGATISWTPNGSATSWDFQYSVNSNFSSPTSYNVSTTPSKAISGLNANTTYYIRVRSVCTNPSDNSVWREGSFTTLICNPADKCNYTLVPNDFYNDGWDGNGYLSFKQNGNEVFTYHHNANANGTNVSIPLCDNVSTNVTYVSGTYLEEVSFTLLDADGVTVFSVEEGAVGNGGNIPNRIWAGETFTTDCNFIVPPTVITQAATGKTQTAAVLHKLVTTGTETITAQGFEYKIAGASSWTISLDGILTNLAANTNYVFKAFATTASGTTYGNELTFSTLAHVAPTVTTQAATGKTQTSALLNKNVTPGTETITAQGFKYRKVSESTWINSADGILSNLIPNTEYEFYAYANTATYPNNNGATLTFSTLAHVAPTVITQAATGKTLTSAVLNKTVTAGTETPITEGFKYKKVSESNWINSADGVLSNLIPNTEYEFYAYANTATYPNNYGATLTFSTLAHTPPTVTTLPMIDYDATSAVLLKSVEPGTETIISEGFKYKKVSETDWENSADGVLSNLIPNTEYEFYAFATTETFDIHGDTLRFTTAVTGIDDILENSISIYPNPVTDELKIESVELKINSIQITDISGKIILNSPLINNSINVSSFPQGVYLIRINTDNGVKTERFIKK